MANVHSSMLRTGLVVLAVTVLLATILLAVRSSSGGAPPEGQPMLRIHSAAFDNQAEIPEKFTCEGRDVSPPLSWDGIPSEARSLVLIVDDPDAPDPTAPRRPWVHWLLFDIPPLVLGLPEAMRELPPGTLEGLNDWLRTGYGGPCPPAGRHRYFFKLYALDTKLKLVRPDKNDLIEAMEGHVLARTELVGTYELQKKD